MKNLDNKLIAEFMGLETSIFTSGILYYYHVEYHSGSWYEEEELGYNESWDWLIPVVEEIESLRNEDGNAYRFTIDMCNAKIDETNIDIIGGSYKLDSTYKAVVEFINKYS